MATIAVTPEPVAVLSAAASIAKRLEREVSLETRSAEFMCEHPGFDGEIRFDSADLDGWLDDPSPVVFNAAAGCDFQDELLPLVSWWRDLQDNMAMELMPEPGFEMDPEIKERLESACRAMNDVFVALGPALTASCRYHEEPELYPLFDTFRRYRRWTRMLCQLARKTWPDVDWSDLDQLV